MSTDLESIIVEAFHHDIETSQLRVCKVQDDEVLLVGQGFSLLTWLDRDGISMWYLDLDSDVPEMINLGHFLAMQRQWRLDESIPLDGSMQSQNLRGVKSFAKTLHEVGEDILSGDKTWLKLASMPPLPMNAIHYTKLRNASMDC
jgi:hypothetical protein